MTQRSTVRRVALTGGIATGKTYVRQAFDKLGVPTIDADTLAREAVAPGSVGLAQVVERFGPEVLDSAGALDRRRLAAIVFSDSNARHDLENIIHPFVRRETDQWFAGLDPSKHRFAVADIPLLFETGRNRDFDTVIVAAAEPGAQIRRLQERDGLIEAEARQRIEAQLPIQLKIDRADFVIRTDVTFADTDRQAKLVLDALNASAA